MFRVEQHRLGPRYFVLGRRIHEYQLGLAILAANVLLFVSELVGLSPFSGASALVGGWLVIKDWRDLFPSTRDTYAHRRFKIHRRPESTD